MTASQGRLLPGTFQPGLKALFWASWSLTEKGRVASWPTSSLSLSFRKRLHLQQLQGQGPPQQPAASLLSGSPI